MLRAELGNLLAEYGLTQHLPTEKKMSGFLEYIMNKLIQIFYPDLTS